MNRAQTQTKVWDGPSLSYSGFVIPESGGLFVCKPKTFNYKTTIDSIRDFLDTHPVTEGKKYSRIG